MGIIKITAAVIVCSVAAQSISAVSSGARDLLNGAVEDGYIKLLLKALGTALAAKTGADICNDSGNTALAGVVELAGKVLVIMICMSMLRTVVSFTGGMLK